MARSLESGMERIREVREIPAPPAKTDEEYQREFAELRRLFQALEGPARVAPEE